MSIEVESKYRLTDSGQLLRERLDLLGAKGAGCKLIADTYLRHPARDFAQTGEAFRIRREGDTTCLTYKGPKTKADGVKTREEIEIALADAEDVYDQAVAMFTALGFTEVLTIEKFRESFEIVWNDRTVKVLLDDAHELGIFAEVELVLEDGVDPATAEATIKSIATELGLTQYEPRSYLRMWLEHYRML